MEAATLTIQSIGPKNAETLYALTDALKEVPEVQITCKACGGKMMVTRKSGSGPFFQHWRGQACGQPAPETEN